ncbi:NosD domain-containing protein [Candidatus Omnitrophota bacterium]
MKHFNFRNYNLAPAYRTARHNPELVPIIHNYWRYLAIGFLSLAMLGMFTACQLFMHPAWAQDAGVEMTVEDDLTVSGTEGTDADPDLEVRGFAEFGATPASDHSLSGQGSVLIGGALEVDGTGFFDNTLSVSAAGDTAIAHDLYFSNGSASQITSNVALSIISGSAGDVDLTLQGFGAGSVYVDDNLEVTGNLGILDGSATHHTIFQGGTQGDDITYTLPTQAAASDDYVLTSTTAGILQWQDTASLGGGTMDDFTLSDGTNTQLIEDADTLQVLGGTAINTLVEATDQVTISVGNNSIDGTQLANDITLDADLAFETDTLFIGQDGGSYAGMVGIGTTDPEAGYLLDVEGPVIFQNSTDSTNAFMIRTEAAPSDELFWVNTDLETVSVGETSSGYSKLGVLQLDSGSSLNAFHATSYGTGALMILADEGNPAFTVQNEGHILSRNRTDSTTAWVIQDATNVPFFDIDTTNRVVGIGTTTPSANADLTLEGGVLNLKETTTPTADTDYGKIYTKNDNKLYFQDGAGSEHALPTSNTTGPTLIVAASTGTLDDSRADYVCDGTDDDDTIETAIGDLPAGGGTVLLLEGTYSIGDTAGDGIDITDSDVALIGSGRSTELRVTASSGNVNAIVVGDGGTTAVTGVVISNLQINGNKGSSVGNHGIYFNQKVSESRIENNWIHDCDGDAVYFSAGFTSEANFNNVIQGNDIRSNDGNGIEFYVANNNTIIRNNIVSSGVAGISIDESNANIISNNNIESSAGDGIAFGSNNATGNIVTSNVIDGVGSSADGIYFDNADESIISLNYINDDDSSGYGINVSAGTSTNNYLIGNEIVTTSGFTSDISDSGTGTTIQHRDQFEIDADGDIGLTVTQSGAADIVNVLDGTTEVFTILDGGNVGIGITNPGYLLDVRGGANAIHAVGTTSAVIGYYSATGSNYYGALAYGSTGVYGQSPFFGVHGNTSGTGSGTGVGVYGTSTGDNGAGVEGYNSGSGIGVEARSTTGMGLRVNLSGAGTEIARFDDNNNPVFVIDDGGNVGVGTTNPGQLLTVDGTLGIIDGSTNYHTIFQGGTQGDDITYTLPTQAAASDDYVLTSTTAGILQWQDTASLGGGTMDDFTLSDGTNTQLIEDTDTLQVLGGTAINTLVEATDQVTISVGNNSIDGTQLANDITLDADLAFETDTLFIGQDGGSYAGNVGIGTSVPSEALEIDGNLYMSGGDIKTDRWLQQDSNTFIGVGVVGDGNLAHTTDEEGYFNTFVGSNAGASNTTGWRNTFVGYGAGEDNTTAYRNSFFGFGAGNRTIGGEDNTFLGHVAGYYNTSGINNAFVGAAAGYRNTTGDRNAFIGSAAGAENTTGYRNTFIGYDAGANNTTGNWNIFLGQLAGYNETSSNKLYIANSWNLDDAIIYGEFNNHILRLQGDTLVADPSSLGAEKVSDGNFDTGAPWTFNANWAYDGTDDEADHTSGSTAVLEQGISAAAGEVYYISFEVKKCSAGTVTPSIGGVSGTAINTPGASTTITSSQIITATGTGNLQFTPTSDFDGSVDTVTVKQITGGDLRIVGNQAVDGTLGILDGSASFHTIFQGGTQGDDITYTLPTQAAASDDYVLTSTTAGILQWQDTASLGGGTMDDFTLSDGTNTQLIEDADTLQVLGGTAINTLVEATDQVTISVGNNSIDGTQLADDITLDADLAFETDTLFIGQDGGSYAGMVGIGTSVPGNELEITSSDTESKIFVENSGGTSTDSAVIEVQGSLGQYIRLRAPRSSTGPHLIFSASGLANEAFIDIPDGRSLRFEDGTNSFMTILDQGTTANVGIGTTTPTKTLEVDGDAKISNSLEVTAAGDTYIAHDLYFSNVTSSQISSNKALSIISGSAGENVDLTLQGQGTGVVYVDDNLELTGTMGILDGSATYQTIFQGGTQGDDITYTLPTAVPAADDYILTSTTGGVMEWQDITALGAGNVWTRTGTNLSPSTAEDDVYLGSNELLGVGYDPSTISGGVAAFNGNVGIGITDPTAKLHVDGSAKFESNSGGGTFRVGNMGGAADLRIYRLYAAHLFNPSGSQDHMVMNTGGWDASPIISYDSFGIDNSVATNPALILEGAASQTADFMQVRPNGATEGTIFTINSSGNVGIGTTSPAANLNIKGSLTAALSGTVTVASSSAAVTGTSTAFTTELNEGDAIKIAGEVFTVSTITDATHLTLDSNHSAGATDVTAYSDSDLYLVENGDAIGEFVIDKSGNVGIGVTVPEALLQVGDNAGPAGMIFIDAYWGGTLRLGGEASEYVDVGYSSGSNYFYIDYEDAEFYMRNGNVGIGDNYPTAHLEVSANGTSGENIFFLSSDDDNNGDILTVTEAGNVGIGTTTPGQLLTVDGTLGILDGSSTFHTIFQGGTQGADITYTLPTAVAAADDYVLTSTTAGVLEWQDASSLGGASEWTLASGVVHPNAATTDVAVGGTTLAGSIFSIDEDTGTFLLGGDQSANPILRFEATDSDTADFGFNTEDTFYFTDSDAVCINATSAGGMTGSENAELFVQQAVAAYSALTIKSVGAGLQTGAPLQVRDTANESFFRVGEDVATVQIKEISTQTEDLLNITSSGGSDGDLLTITDDGNVGIGTTSPASELEIDGELTVTGTGDSDFGGNVTIDTGYKFILDDDDAEDSYITHDNTNNYVTLFADGTQVQTLTSAGNVGIGTTNPGQLLTVDGTLGILDGSSTFHTILQGGTQGDDITYTLPTAAAAADDYVLTSTTGGVMEWQDVSGLVGAGYWSKSNNNLSPATSGDDIYLGTNELLGVGYDPSDITNSVAAFSGTVAIGTTNPYDMGGLWVEGSDVCVIDNGGDPALVLGDSENWDNFGFIRWHSGTDQIRLGTGVSAYDDWVSITESGDVGIGTTNPTYNLHLRRDQNADTDMLVENQTNDTAASASIGLMSGTSTGSWVAYSSNYTAGGLSHFADRVGLYANNDATGLDLVGVNASSDMRFYTGGLLATNERMRITSAGNVGIGTTTPSANADLTLEGGVICLKETATPTDDADYGKIYTKSDNKLYFQDGAGSEHTLPTSNTTGPTLIIAASTGTLDNTRADYICDGTDDEATIETAISDLPATGGTVLLLEGTYNIGGTSSDNIDITKSNVSLVGSGRSTILKVVASSGTVSAITVGDGGTATVTGVTIANLQIDGNKSSATGNHGIVFNRHVTQSRIQNTWVHDCDSVGIFLTEEYDETTTNSNVVFNNDVRNNTDEGIYFYAVHNSLISSNNISSNGSAGIFMFGGSSNNVISSNDIRSNTATGIFPSDYDMIIANNIELNDQYGIYLSSSTNYATITGNTIDSNDYHGVYIANNADNNVVSSNVIIDNGESGDYDGINIGSGTSSDNNLISSNFISDSLGSGYGIRVTSAANNNYIIGNEITGVGSGFTAEINDAGTGTTIQQRDQFDLVDGGILDLSGIVHDDSAAQGIKLPQANSLTNMPGAGEGYIAWDLDGDTLNVFDGTNWNTVGGGTSYWDDQTDYIEPNTIGANYLAITDAGELGIGTTNPDQLLHVDGNMCATGDVGIGTTNPGAKLDINAGNVYIDGNQNYKIWAYGNFGLTNTNADMMLGHNIEATSDDDFDVDYTHASFGYRGIKFDAGSDNEGIQFYTYRGSVTAGDDISNERMRITNTGNVGIGLTNPGEKLEVDGNIKLSGVVLQGTLGDLAEMMSVSACILQPANLTFDLPQIPLLLVKADNYEESIAIDSKEKYAEYILGKPEAGDVVVVEEDGGIRRSYKPYAKNVVGIISTEPAQILQSDLEDAAPVALSGIVPCKVSCENGTIMPGDLLVASSTPGYAMRADNNPPAGTVIAKALSRLDENEGAGIVKALVMLQ